MQPPKNRFQILILHPKKHSYKHYKEINIHFLIPINWKIPFWTKATAKNGQKNLYFRGVNSDFDQKTSVLVQ